MKTNDFVSALKEFFLDFLGYFSPGFITMLLLTIIMSNESKIQIPSILNGDNGPIIFVFISYVLGYVIFSVSEIFINYFIRFCNFFLSVKINNREAIKDSIRKDESIDLVKNKLKVIWKTEGLLDIEIDNYLEKLDGFKLRNLSMSFTPESDAKIYTFTFRSDLSRHLAFIFFNIGILGIIFWMINLFRPFLFFKTEGVYVLLYLLMIIAPYYLSKSFSLFLSISYRIPFSIFLAKKH